MKYLIFFYYDTVKIDTFFIKYNLAPSLHILDKIFDKFCFYLIIIHKCSFDVLLLNVRGKIFLAISSAIPDRTGLQNVFGLHACTMYAGILIYHTFEIP